MHFHLRRPDGREARCYSPSLVIKDYVVPETAYPLDDFLSRTREALGIASERVRAKYGFACSMAMDQLAQIEAEAAAFAHRPEAAVQVLAFDESA